jgi:hypothetical protein
VLALRRRDRPREGWRDGVEEGGVTEPLLVDLRTKRHANLVARAALAGWVIRVAPEHTIADGTLVAERWGNLRFLRDLDEAERWLELVTGKKAA